MKEIIITLLGYIKHGVVSQRRVHCKTRKSFRFGTYFQLANIGKREQNGKKQLSADKFPKDKANKVNSSTFSENFILYNFFSGKSHRSRERLLSDTSGDPVLDMVSKASLINKTHARSSFVVEVLLDPTGQYLLNMVCGGQVENYWFLSISRQEQQLRLCSSKCHKIAKLYGFARNFSKQKFSDFFLSFGREYHCYKTCFKCQQLLQLSFGNFAFLLCF